MKSSGKDIMPLHIVVLEVTEGQKDSAMITCAENAVDVIELRLFLEQLGLIDAR